MDQWMTTNLQQPCLKFMLHYKIHKKSPDAEWVTFIHGAGGSSSIWFRQIRDFQKHFNVLLIDLRGHGKSKSPMYEKLKALHLRSNR